MHSATMFRLNDPIMNIAYNEKHDVVLLASSDFLNEKGNADENRKSINQFGWRGSLQASYKAFKLLDSMFV